MLQVLRGRNRSRAQRQAIRGRVPIRGATPHHQPPLRLNQPRQPQSAQRRRDGRHARALAIRAASASFGSTYCPLPLPLELLASAAEAWSVASTAPTSARVRERCRTQLSPQSSRRRRWRRRVARRHRDPHADPPGRRPAWWPNGRHRRAAGLARVPCGGQGATRLPPVAARRTDADRLQCRTLVGPLHSRAPPVPQPGSRERLGRAGADVRAARAMSIVY